MMRVSSKWADVWATPNREVDLGPHTYFRSKRHETIRRTRFAPYDFRQERHSITSSIQRDQKGPRRGSEPPQQ